MRRKPKTENRLLDSPFFEPKDIRLSGLLNRWVMEDLAKHHEIDTLLDGFTPYEKRPKIVSDDLAKFGLAEKY